MPKAKSPTAAAAAVTAVTHWPFPNDPPAADAAAAPRASLAALDLYTNPDTNDVHRLPVDVLEDSPTNPRSRYPQAGLQEMADTMQQVGVLEPILVRPLRSADPHVVDGQGQPQDTYQIVFGHRRVRAARLAGLDRIPAIVRALSDAHAAQLQAIENLQREDLDPLDEAEGYQAYLRAHGITKQQLADEIGKSRTHVYNRLKLATLGEDGRTALREGRIDAEVATLIARVPTKHQPKAIAIACETDWRKNRKSFRNVRADLLEKFSCDLADAPWDLDDAGLDVMAGRCTTCPKRSGASPEQFADLVKLQGDDDDAHIEGSRR
jgi:ParB/RepB/Spo0J family partition protein